MIRRRVHQGQAYILTRAGWRAVRDGYILTRKGWRKLRRRAGRRRSSNEIPITDAPAPVVMLSPRRQWLGKYAALLRHDEGR